MTSKQLILFETQKEVENNGHAFDKAVFEKAYKKLQIWCKNAYGTSSTKTYVEENGENCGILFYYQECSENVKNTFNKQGYQSRRNS